MPVNTLYFIPWTSITETTPVFGSINTGQDIGNLFAALFQTNTIQLTGPTSSFEIEDNGSTPNTLVDDFEFTEQTLTTAFGSDPAGSGVETLYSYTLQGSDNTTITIYGVAIGGSATDDVLDGFVASAPLVPGVTYTVSGLQSIVDVDYADLVPCFASGSMITTASGQMPVEDLSVGDLVMTVDHGFQPLRWTGGRTVSFNDRVETLKQRPLRIKANALGRGIPCADLWVSPQHRMLLRSRICERMFAAKDVLIAAKHLTKVDGIATDMTKDETQYVHLLFDRHEVLWANGAPTESLFKGRQALKAVGPEGFQDIARLDPRVCNPDYQPTSARQIVEGKRARKLVARHLKNHKPLVETLPAVHDSHAIATGVRG